MKDTYTFAIGLPRFSARYAHITDQLRKRIVDRYEVIGIDGSELDLSKVVSAEALTSRMSSGQAGCALSHIAAYRRMVELDLPHAMIIEDDAVLSENIKHLVADCLPHLSPFGVISFYNPRPKPTRYSDRGAPALSTGRLLSPVATLDTHTTTAYLIGRHAAEKIAHYNFPLRHLADQWFAFHKIGAVDRVLLHYPMPVSTAHFDSSIGYDTGIRSAIKSLLLSLSPVRHAVNLRRAKEEQRQKTNILVVDAPTFYERKET